MENKNQRTLISFDWAIKRILRQKPNFVILEGFLSVLLNQNLIINQILESESNSNDPLEKINKVDILCESKENELILIELQYNSEIDYFQRMLYGASKIISDYMASGYEYKEIRKIYSINIIYFDLGQGEDYVYYGKTSFEGIHKHDQLKLSKAQEETFNYKAVHQIFPEYYIIKVNKFNDTAKSSLDEWIYYLKNSRLPEKYSAKGLNEAQEILNYLNMDEQTRIDYDAHQKAIAISKSVIETSRIEGAIEGEARGEARGKAKGEADTLINVVLNGYKNGLEISMLSTITKLDEEKVKQILIDAKLLG